MADVARLAGVHQTTVSRALRNDHRVSPEVCARIQAAVKQIGYRPNPLLSALGVLRRQRATSFNQTPLAFVRRSDPVHGINHGKYIPGAREAAVQLGYKMEEYILDDKLHAQRLDTILKARNIQGVILGPLPEAHGSFQLDWSQFATVAIEYSFTEPALDRFVTDGYNALRMALSQCRERGLSRLGLVLAQVVDERNEGLISAAYVLAINRDPSLAPLPPLIAPEWDACTFAAWLQQHRPEVIISSNTLLPQIESFLASARLRVPQDIGLINLNVDPSCQAHTGICLNTHAIGTMAARMVIEKLNRNERGIPASRMTILMHGLWREGETLRAKPSPDKV